MQKIANGIITTLLVYAIGLLAVPVVDAAPLEARVSKLESVVQHQAFRMELSARIEALQAELEALRGQLEEQQHLLERLQVQASAEKKPDLNVASTQNETLALNQAQAEPLNKNSKILYEAAFEYVNRHEHEAAEQALKGFLADFPDAKEAPDAHYWLGEVYFLSWQTDPTHNELKELAEKEFKYLTLYFADHQRAPQAMLKLGLLAEMNQEWDRVKFYLSNLVDQYPLASSTRIAKAKLERLAQEGRI